MKSILEPERVFPLSGGSPERARLRAPQMLSSSKVLPGAPMGNRAFMRAWAARRAQGKAVPPAPGRAS